MQNPLEAKPGASSEPGSRWDPCPALQSCPWCSILARSQIWESLGEFIQLSPWIKSPARIGPAGFIPCGRKSRIPGFAAVGDVWDELEGSG